MFIPVLQFLKSPAGTTLLFVATVMCFFYFVAEYRDDEESQEADAAGNSAESLPRLDEHVAQLDEKDIWQPIEQEPQLPESVSRGGFQKFTPAKEKAKAEVPVAAIPAASPAPLPAKPPTLLHFSEVIPQEEIAVPEKPEIPQVLLPRGTMIPCELVLTIETGAANTPVLGQVTQPVYHLGSLVVPMGAEVHGPGSAERRRNRILMDGNWFLVFPDGRELSIEGSALHRTFDPVSGRFGVADGSVGIMGTVVETDEHRELKLLASSAISGLTQSRSRGFWSLFGSGERRSLEDNLLEGGSAVIDRYASRLLEESEENGLFVRVPAGTEFYLYCRESILPAGAEAAQSENVGGTSSEPASTVARLLKEREKILSRLK